jgi:hypothetical protein
LGSAMALHNEVRQGIVRGIIELSDLARKEVSVAGIHKNRAGRPFRHGLGVDWTSTTTDSERRVYCLGGLAAAAEDIPWRSSKRRHGAADGCHATDQGEQEGGVELHGKGYLFVDYDLFVI